MSVDCAAADACHAAGMRFGLYYSQRDWHHPDYLVGDNVKYDTWYRGQVEELLTTKEVGRAGDW